MNAHSPGEVALGYEAYWDSREYEEEEEERRREEEREEEEEAMRLEEHERLCGGTAEDLHAYADEIGRYMEFYGETERLKLAVPLLRAIADLMKDEERIEETDDPFYSTRPYLIASAMNEGRRWMEVKLKAEKERERTQELVQSVLSAATENYKKDLNAGF